MSFKSKLDSDVLTPGSWCDAMQIEQSRKELEHAAELQVGAQIRLQARQVSGSSSRSRFLAESIDHEIMMP